MTAEECVRRSRLSFTPKHQGHRFSGSSSAKKTLSKMNGVINLESEHGQGTVAVVQLAKGV